jgi:hypothetical protein
MKLDVRMAGSLVVLVLGAVLGFGESTTVDPAFAPVPSVNFSSADEMSGKIILIPTGRQARYLKGRFCQCVFGHYFSGSRLEVLRMLERVTKGELR